MRQKTALKQPLCSVKGFDLQAIAQNAVCHPLPSAA